MYKVIEYNKYPEKYIKSLPLFENLPSYKYLFSSREWIETYLKIYSVKNSFLFLSEADKSFFSLSLADNRIFFTGDPFNDFNGFYPFFSTYKFVDIVSFILSFLGDKNVMLNSMIDERTEDFKRQIFKNSFFEESLGLSIRCANQKEYLGRVSKRIFDMYTKHKNKLKFFRLSGDDLPFHKHILEFLLKTRRDNLILKKPKEFNPSFELSFDNFIRTLLEVPSFKGSVIVDCCMVGEDVLAANLNFLHKSNLICYLRSCVDNGNNISLGLILDVWSNLFSIKGGITCIDYTRGNEFYKYRLGAEEYKLINFIH